jgi:hypothetical protein
MNNSPSSAFHTPLSQVFPWKDNETILVSDSVTCDGRFVLYTMAAAVLTASNSTTGSRSPIGGRSADNHNGTNVLWLGCTPITNSSILASLKRIGCDSAVVASAHHLPEGNLLQGPVLKSSQTEKMSRRLTVLSIPALFEKTLVTAIAFDEEVFVKDIFRTIKVWLTTQRNAATSSLSWLIVDDVTALASVVGECLTYGFLLSLQSLKSSAVLPFSLAVRYSNDYDIDRFGLRTKGDNSDDGGEFDEHNIVGTIRDTAAIPWEHALVEFADTIVDVTPLLSGYSREVHGRLIFRGRSPETGFSMYNYCLTDNQVLVMRLASQQL